MRPSNLQLNCYFVTDINVTANQTFDGSKEIGLRLSDVMAEPECTESDEDAREWQVRLRVSHLQDEKSNSPYFFTIELVGFFKILDRVPDERVERFISVNGASVLFSTAREVLRSVMANGPYDPVLLPTVCFLDSMPEAGKAAEQDGATP